MQENQPNKSPSVLLLADDCNPLWPSLPIVGYNICTALAKQFPVVIATHIRNKKDLEQFPIPNAKIVYIDNEYIAKWMYKIGIFLRGGDSVGWTTHIAMAYPSYLAFEWEVWKKFKPEFHSNKFDLVHRVTPMSPTLPSLLSSKIKIPFVLGPLNGGLRWPKEYTQELKNERDWMTKIRNISRHLPYYQSTYRNSSAILAAFKHTIEDLPQDQQQKIIDYPEVGFDPKRFYPSEKKKKEKITFLFVGRLVPYKNIDILISAFAASPLLRQQQLQIVGDGPETPRLAKMIAEHNLEDSVQLLGKKTQEDVGNIMRKSDVFVFPSIRELGAGVVVEAMACALPCIVVDYGGPATLISPERGSKIPLENKDKLIENFTKEMESRILDRELIKVQGIAAKNYADRLYTWDTKAEQLVAVYNWVLNKTSQKPHFLF